MCQRRGATLRSAFVLIFWSMRGHLCALVWLFFLFKTEGKAVAGFCVKKQPEMASYSLPFEQRIKDVLGWVGKLLGESLVPVSEDTKAVSAAFHSALMTGTRLCQVAQKLYPANALRFNAKP